MITNEQLDEMIKSASNASGPLPPDEKFSMLISALKELRERRLASMGAQEPVYQVQYESGWQDVERVQYDDHIAHGSTVRILYAVPKPLTGPERQELQEYRKAASEIIAQHCGDDFVMPADLIGTLREVAAPQPSPGAHQYSSFEQWWESQHCKPLEDWQSLRCDGGYVDEIMDGQFAAWSAAMLQSEPVSNRDELQDGCWCHSCRPVSIHDMRMIVCPDCGNKRCPHANDHRNACTGSNEPGQEGSAYPAAPQQEVKS